MEGSGGGDYGSGGRMEWELKANLWEWENLTMVYSRQGEALQGGEWESGACSAVTLATSAGAGSAMGDFSIGLASGSSTPSGTSVSSGIPGVGAGRGSSGGDPAPSVKSEPDEQTVAGTPATQGGQEDRLFFDLGECWSRGSEEESLERESERWAEEWQQRGERQRRLSEHQAEAGPVDILQGLGRGRAGKRSELPRRSVASREEAARDVAEQAGGAVSGGGLQGGSERVQGLPQAAQGV
jgi:hypothetical protein